MKKHSSAFVPQLIALGNLMLFATGAERAREQTHELENMQQDECVVQKSGVSKQKNKKKKTKNATRFRLW